jgi:amino-acid N-acetyltransferase
VTAAGRARQAAVRAASGEDHGTVVGLLNAAGLPLAGLTPTLTDFFVAEQEGRVVGAIGLEGYGPDALLRSAVVDPAARGSGIGVALVERVVEHARQRGILAIYLLTTTAEHYFPRFGFHRIGREAVPEAVKASVEFREACPASAAVMRMELARDR